MPGKRRSTAQLTRDRRKIADLYLQGWIQADIAAELGISQQTISNDIAALQSDWLASALIDFNEAKAGELAKIDRLEREYWQAWERSCQDAETLTQKTHGAIQKRETEDGQFVAERPAEVTKTAKGQAGDPRFLQGVQWCIERRCKILGVDAATRIDLVDWRDEARRAGLDPADLFERYVQAAYTAITAGNGEAEG